MVGRLLGLDSQNRLKNDFAQAPLSSGLKNYPNG
jgi:hypothetical protein